MSLVSEFKSFISRGNVVDLAIGVIIGASFGKIVSSFVDDVLMPPLGFLIGGVKFSHLKIVLKQGVGETAPVTFNYGNFIQVSIDFVIIAFAIFMVVKGFNALKRREEKLPPPPPAPSNEEKLLIEIRDLLKEKK